MKRTVAKQLEELIPSGLWKDAWVAGGYAHNPELAEDIDLWVLVSDLDAAELAIREHLIQEGYLSNGASRSRALTRAEGDDAAYAEHPDRFRPVANPVLYLDGHDEADPWKVQILVTTQPDIDTLLSKFDITTHRIAWPLTAPSVFKVGEGYFPLGAQPRVKDWDSPKHTLARLEKISRRYGFEPNAEDVAKLLSLIPPVSSAAREFDDWLTGAF